MRAPVIKHMSFGVVLAVFAAGMWLGLSKARPRAVSLTVIGLTTNWNGIASVVRLTNPGPRFIRYWGYETNVPDYSYLFKSGKKWGPLIVGTGMGAQILRPRDSVDFCALIRDDFPEYQIELIYLELSPLTRLRLNMLRLNMPYWMYWMTCRLPEGAGSVVTPPIKRADRTHMKANEGSAADAGFSQSVFWDHRPGPADFFRSVQEASDA
jgi:hypothetical protein